MHATVSEGSNAIFNVEASGKPAPTYTTTELSNRKWTTIKDATSNTLTVSNASAADVTTYRVIVENGAAGYRNSKSAKLYVLANLHSPLNLPTRASSWARPVTSTPTSAARSLCSNGSRMEPPRHQFQQAHLAQDEGRRNDGTYSVKVTNAVGEASSEDFQITVITPVKIEGSPVDAGIVVGEAGSLTVNASGGGTDSTNGSSTIPRAASGAMWKEPHRPHSTSHPSPPKMKASISAG